MDTIYADTDSPELVATLHVPSEFFQALYWEFEGRMIRLTTFDERNLPDAEQTEIAFRRARSWNLNPVCMRVFNGEFLRYGPDDTVTLWNGEEAICAEPPNV